MPPVDRAYRLRRSPCLPSARLIGCVARRSDIVDGNVYDAVSACPRGELRLSPHLGVATVDVANVHVNAVANVSANAVANVDVNDVANINDVANVNVGAIVDGTHANGTW